MAVTELFESREAHETKDGTTMTRVWATTWSDWDDGTFNYFVGNVLEFTTSYDEMRITDIRIRALDNTNIIVTALYSTEATTSKQKAVPDVKESWEETLDFGSQENSLTRYVHFEIPVRLFDANGNIIPNDSGVEKNWADVWTESGGVAANTPELMYQETRATYIVTIYGSQLFMKRMVNHLNTINRDEFISEYFSEQDDVSDDTVQWDDRGMWLFKACPIERVRHNCWRYDLTFELNPLGWNNQNGLEVNLYLTTVFSGLFAGMRFTTTDGNQSVGGHA